MKVDSHGGIAYKITTGMTESNLEDDFIPTMGTMDDNDNFGGF
jgi:hypothetical protein